MVSYGPRIVDRSVIGRNGARCSTSTPTGASARSSRSATARQVNSGARLWAVRPSAHSTAA